MSTFPVNLLYSLGIVNLIINLDWAKEFNCNIVHPASRTNFIISPKSFSLFLFWKTSTWVEYHISKNQRSPLSWNNDRRNLRRKLYSIAFSCVRLIDGFHYYFGWSQMSKSCLKVLADILCIRFKWFCNYVILPLIPIVGIILRCWLSEILHLLLQLSHSENYVLWEILALMDCWWLT